MDTLAPQKPPSPRQPAAGIFHQETLYMFEDYPERYIMLGRGKRCQIRSESRYVSSLHAVLELRENTRYLRNESDQGYTFVDGLPVLQPTRLWVGNLITLGNCLFVAVDEQGRFPIAAYGITDLCCKAAILCGGLRPAGRYLGKDHTYIGRRVQKAEGP